MALTHTLAQSSACRGADRPACAGAGSRNRPAFRQSFCGRSLAIGLILALAGCGTIHLPSIPSIPSVPSIPAATQDGVIASGAFARPAVAIAKDGTIHVAAEGPPVVAVNYFTSKGNKWAGGEIIRASKDTAGRCYVPDVVPDVVSWRWGNKEYGKLHGPGLYVAGKVLYPGLTLGAARLAEHNGTVYLLTKNGVYGQLDKAGNVVKVGTFPAGLTGEKYAFAIDEKGTWHTAHNGSALQASSYAWGTPDRGTRVVWADDKAYPDAADDLNYPSICAANGTAYIAANYGGRIVIQIMDSGKPRYSVTSLPSIGPGTKEQRCPPRLVATPAGPVAIWRQGRDIVAVNVVKALSGTAKPVRVATGEYPDAAAGPDGKVHLVYVNAGNLMHMTLEAP